MTDDDKKRAGGLRPEHVVEVAAKLKEELVDRPPTFGVVGVSGVGKSSTINAMFRTSLPTSATVACTKEFRAVPLDVAYHDKLSDVREVVLTVVDAPGLGEDVARDAGYLSMYQENLDRCDIILWVMSARHRAVALDQQYLAQLARFHDKMVLGLSQVDLVEPLDWVDKYNIPSGAQERNINEIRRDRIEKVRTVVGRELPTVAYSAKYGFELQTLFTTILQACPPNRRWIYAGLQNFSYTDFIPALAADAAHGRAASLVSRLFGQSDGK